MAGLFGSTPTLPPVQAPPPMPSYRDPAVSHAGRDAIQKQAMAQGRASTYLTNPQTQRTAQPSAQRHLGIG